MSEVLAKEGAKYNIITNAIAPIAASRMTETVLPEAILKHLKPEWVVPLVAVLVHESNTEENGGIFEVGAGHIAKLRWERSRGVLFKTDESMTPSALLKRWSQIEDFKDPTYPSGPADFLTYVEEAQALGPNEQGEPTDFTGKVVIVTGAGGGYVFNFPSKVEKLADSFIAWVALMLSCSLSSAPLSSSTMS